MVELSSIESIEVILTTAADTLTAVSETAQLDAEVLLCYCLQKNRSFLRAWPTHRVNTQQFIQFQSFIAQRRQGTPIAYLTGEREFWSRNFKVSPDVLIPRPDSELLIELSLDLLSTRNTSKIIDLGAGSGILGLTLADERPLSDVLATDISAAALQIARQNAEQLKLNNIRFLQSNWFDQVIDSSFDLVVSNPPYIAASDPHLQQGDVRFEPQTALISDENGLKDIRLIAFQARQHLRNGGHLLIEHGYNQQAEAQAIFSQFHYRQINTHKDLSGNPRVTSGVWNPL